MCNCNLLLTRDTRRHRSSVQAWEAITFFVLYLVYILVVIFRERKKSQWFDDASTMADSAFFDDDSSNGSDSDEYAEWSVVRSSTITTCQ